MIDKNRDESGTDMSRYFTHEDAVDLYRVQKEIHKNISRIVEKYDHELRELSEKIKSCLLLNHKRKYFYVRTSDNITQKFEDAVVDDQSTLSYVYWHVPYSDQASEKDFHELFQAILLLGYDTKFDIIFPGSSWCHDVLNKDIPGVYKIYEAKITLPYAEEDPDMC